MCARCAPRERIFDTLFRHIARPQVKCGAELTGKAASRWRPVAAGAMKKTLDAALRHRAQSFEACGRLRGRASCAAHIYMPHSLPIGDLFAQVSAWSLILCPVWLPAERQRAHVVAPHRQFDPQTPTAAIPDGPKRTQACSIAQNPPWHVLTRIFSRLVFYPCSRRWSGALSAV